MLGAELIFGRVDDVKKISKYKQTVRNWLGKMLWHKNNEWIYVKISIKKYLK